MCDCMDFPKEPEEFIKGYSFKDCDEVYTNGSELIQVFRVKQMLEHYMSKSNSDSEFVKLLWENMQPNEMEQWQEMFRTRNDKSEPTCT